ncbi:1-acyl-sn-glycerol-3-phosphate acyltransferase [Chitinivorax sp. PXF-14]|uniref:1-acyl-sn-glycerol-3-phosphate acyltransferase n=1 Tax=Chitinivorax sp. PXF-14 TaxID=3230488 RepID=UPI0034678206
MINLSLLLADKFPAFARWPAPLRGRMIAWLGWLLCLPEIDAFLQLHGHRAGLEFVGAALDYLNVRWRAFGLEHIPREGPLVIVANHPLGALDGLSLLQAMSTVRPDVRVVVNDMLWQFKPLRDVMLPVVNVGRGDNKGHICAINTELRGGGAIMLFPSGEVSRWSRHGIRDQRWRKGFLHFAREAEASIVPVHIGGRNSGRFYMLSLLSKPLAMPLLPGEIFRNRNAILPIRVGQALQWRGIADQASFDELADTLRAQVYRLAATPRGDAA